MDIKMKTNKIVQIRKSVIFTTTLIIAENCGVTHEATIKLVRKFLLDLQKVGLVGFQIRLNKQGSATEFAELDDYAAMLLLTYMRNTEVVAKFKLDLITEFKRMRDALNDPNRANAIKHKRAAHNPMMDAVIFAHDLAGIEPPSKMDFISENLLCNMAVTGNWAAAKEVELDSYELKMLEAIRYHNGILVQHNISIADRVMKLKAYAENYRKKHPHLKLLK